MQYLNKLNMLVAMIDSLYEDQPSPTHTLCEKIPESPMTDMTTLNIIHQLLNLLHIDIRSIHHDLSQLANVEALSVLSDLLHLFDVSLIPNSPYHRCWSVGNNKNGQQANACTLRENKRLQIMNKLPNNVYINDVITGCWGSTYIIHNTSAQMDEEDNALMVFGCNESSQLSINDQVTLIIIKHWSHHIALTQGIIKLIQTKTQQLCFGLGSLCTPLNVDQFNIINHKISFMSQGIGGHHKFIVTQDKLTEKDHLFGVGRNDHNQLGAADRLNRTQFTEIKYFRNISVELAQIHCARDYTHFLTEKGLLFESSERSIAIRPIKMPATIIDLCCGYEHTLAIDQNRGLYAWGDNLYGQLGHGRYKSRITAPKMVRWLHQNRVYALEISAGQYHSCMLSTAGQLHVFGWNEFYQCGDEMDQNIVVPKLNPTLHDKGIKEIKCGFNHNVAVTDDDEYYFWGHNRYNQCMVYGEDKKYVKKPTKWKYKKDIGKYRKILAIYPGWCSTIVVTT